MAMFKVVFIFLEVLFLFNVLIIAHELGHFLAARWRGMTVDRFGIWFGKPIWRKEINAVTYCLGFIPAGGFVSLPQMALMESIEGKVDEKFKKLPPMPPLDKIIVAFAGPLFSFGLAVFFAIIIWLVGRPVGEADMTTIIGHVKRNSPAEKAGLKAGDKIISVDGHKVTRFSGIGDTVMWRVVSSEGDKISIEIERGGQRLTVQSDWVRESTKPLERRSLREIQIYPKKTPLVARVEPNSPAALAGLRADDVIVGLNGRPLLCPEALGDYIEEHGTNRILLTIQRGMEKFVVMVVPEVPFFPPDFPPDQKRALIGVEWDLKGRWTLDHPGPVQQIEASVGTVVNTLQALLSHKSGIGPQHLSGPVGILRIYYILFESEHGWLQAVWFSVILNVNLALLNLLPLPVLDGGHILLAMLDAVRRRPVNAKVLSTVLNTCAALVIGYVLYVSFYDVQDLPWRRAKRDDIKFAPKNIPATAQPASP
jgi:regulator of sigma E protease